MSTIRSINPDHFPHQGSFEEKAHFTLQYAILAPSAHNNQPWKVQLSNEELTIQLDPEFTVKGPPRLSVITLGAFVENFMEAAAHFNFQVQLEPLPLKADLFKFTIRILPSESTPTGYPQAFQGILSRHTNRGLYQPEPLTDEVLQTLRETVVDDGVEVAFITDASLRRQAGKLASVGMHIALSLPPLRKELSHFVHFASENNPTGMLAEAMVAGACPSQQGETGEQWTLHHLPLKEEVALCHEKFATAPLHVIVSTPKDSFRDQFAAGRTMERILNTAGGLGLTHCIAAAATEVPVITPRIRAMSGSSAKPQLFFRLGIPQNPGFTLDSPRRSVEQIVKAQ